MRLLVDSRGRITGSTSPLSEGLNILGTVTGRLRPSSFELEPFRPGTDEEAVPELLDGPAIFIKTDKERLLWACSDMSSHRDLFWSGSGKDGYALSDDFFEASQTPEKLTPDREAISVFIDTGHFPGGRTYFREVHRVRTGHRLVFRGSGGLAEEPAPFPYEEEEPARDQENFRKAFRSVLRVRAISGGDVILLSGGCDSGLIAAAAVKEFSVKPLLITSDFSPGSVYNSKDIERSLMLAKLLGLDHRLVKVDFDSIGTDFLDRYIDKMPLASYVLPDFYLSLSCVERRDERRIWSGQNADCIYELGPSHRSLADMVKRFYLSRLHLGTLSDVEPSPKGAAAVRAAAEMGRIFFNISGQSACRPSAIHELAQAYAASREYLPFPKQKAVKRRQPDRIYTTREARQIIFTEKAFGHFKGGHSAVHRVTSDILGYRGSVCPFSSANMVRFFIRHETSLSGIFKPKRYIYSYFEELIGREDFRKTYRQGWKLNTSYDWYPWSRKVLHKTRLGKELMGAVRDTDTDLRISPRLSPLEKVMGLYWTKKVMERFPGRIDGI